MHGTEEGRRALSSQFADMTVEAIKANAETDLKVAGGAKNNDILVSINQNNNKHE